jgi:hypothetical protein
MKNNNGSFQNFYAHFSCLKGKLHKDIHGYLVRDDEDDVFISLNEFFAGTTTNFVEYGRLMLLIDNDRGNLSVEN